MPRYRVAIEVPQHYREHVFYHGTADAKVAKQILQAGELRPGDVRDSPMSPVAGRVYMTPDLEYVLSYVLGAHQSCSADVLCKRSGRYGYLFVVAGQDLTDVLIDEDMVGEAICSQQPRWLKREFEALIDNYPRAYENMIGLLMQDRDTDDPMEEYYFMDELMSCAFPEVPTAGKFFLEHADDDKILELIGELEGAAISNKGPVRFRECWRFDKRQTPQLKLDGSNFFELAKQVQ